MKKKKRVRQKKSRILSKIYKNLLKIKKDLTIKLSHQTKYIGGLATTDIFILSQNTQNGKRKGVFWKKKRKWEDQPIILWM